MAAGDAHGRGAQLVFLPPDKANHDWWGRTSRSGRPSRRASPSCPSPSGRRRRSSGSGAPPAAHHGAPRGALLPVRRAIFALSGQHSVYGRGTIGRAIEEGLRALRDAASRATPRMSRVSAFYRPFLSVALAAHGLLYLPRAAPPAGDGADGGVWISRGKGLGNGYGKTVGRRCLNEEEVLGALHGSRVALRLTPLELAGMPLAQQLPHFRGARVLTGMHGAGYANLIFLGVGAVVAELCPLGYCTQSYQRLSRRLGVTYLRWTNTIAENAREGYDTIVDTAQFVGLMGRAVEALREVRPHRPMERWRRRSLRLDMPGSADKADRTATATP